MKRHVQKPGVRKWAGEDLIELQSESLKVLDGFFAEYGPAVVQGCVATKTGSTYKVSAGLVAIEGTDAEGNDTLKVVPFRGAEGVALPLYLTLAWETREREYKNAEVKPVAYDYYAKPSSVKPTSGKYFTLSESGTKRFTDAIQDSDHRFLTDAERTAWNDKVSSATYTAAMSEKSDKATSFVEARGIIQYKDLDTYVNRPSGTYRIPSPDGQSVFMLSVLRHPDISASSLEILHNYSMDIFKWRSSIDSNRYSPWRDIYHSGNSNPNTQLLPAGYDVNLLQTTGTYNIDRASNAPAPGWFYYDIIKHSTGGNWVSQTAYSFGASNIPNRIFHRNGTHESSWTPWVELLHTGNVVSCVWAGVINTGSGALSNFSGGLGVTIYPNYDSCILECSQAGVYSISVSSTDAMRTVGAVIRGDKRSFAITTTSATKTPAPMDVNVQIFKVG